jgi:hypothetical protein
VPAPLRAFPREDAVYPGLTHEGGTHNQACPPKISKAASVAKQNGSTCPTDGGDRIEAWFETLRPPSRGVQYQPSPAQEPLPFALHIVRASDQDQECHGRCLPHGARDQHMVDQKDEKGDAPRHFALRLDRTTWLPLCSMQASTERSWTTVGFTRRCPSRSDISPPTSWAATPGRRRQCKRWRCRYRRRRIAAASCTLREQRCA